MTDIDWRPETAYSSRAELADPADLEHSRFVLSVLATADDIGASWSVWGNRMGDHVAGTAANGLAARRRAERVFRAITGNDDLLEGLHEACDLAETLYTEFSELERARLDRTMVDVGAVPEQLERLRSLT